jgi:hypothetical protein
MGETWGVVWEMEISPCTTEEASVPNVRGRLGRFNPDRSLILILPKLRICDERVPEPWRTAVLK